MTSVDPQRPLAHVARVVLAARSPASPRLERFKFPRAPHARAELHQRCEPASQHRQGAEGSCRYRMPRHLDHVGHQRRCHRLRCQRSPEESLSVKTFA